MRIDFKSKKSFGLIGYPLGHSVSPFIHSALFRLKGENASYDLIELEKDALEESFEEKLKALNGFNVTIPHKLNIIPFLDELSPRAKLFGAVNTVEFSNGRAIGHNTDCTGFLRSLDAAGIELGGRVLICGCGGVSRMFAFESALAEADITLAVRETGLEKAEALRQELFERLGTEVKMITLGEAKGGYDLIINGTPAGMFPNTEACPVAESAVKNSRAVFDAVYNPLETRLIRFAKEGGLKYVNGLPMLVWQAAAAEELWNDVKFSKEEIAFVIRQTEKELRGDE